MNIPEQKSLINKIPDLNQRLYYLAISVDKFTSTGCIFGQKRRAQPASESDKFPI
jgi:hypothetical protein